MRYSAWARRLHDRGRSGWWLLVVVVPLVGALFLIVECALRGSRPGAEPESGDPGVAGHYLTVR